MTSRLLLIPVLAVACVLVVGCGKSGGTDTNNNNNNNNNNENCPAGHEPSGPACLPVFDECPGDAEIAVLGGGCMQIGVTRCATGFTADGAGGCDPVLPAEPCPTGTMEVIGSTECQPVGIRQCADGFVAKGEGGCDAVLPAGPCGPGTIALLGHTDCQPLGDCSTGTWGAITPDATTVFVDANYSGGNSDGSDASPFHRGAGHTVASRGAIGRVGYFQSVQSPR